jgi:hypothetical protein
VREHIAAQFEKVVELSRRQYGHLFETTWWYENEWCPCWGRQRVGLWVERDGQTSLSLNGFVYTEQRVLIGYLLCASCVETLRRVEPQRYAKMHEQIEGRLMQAYHEACDTASVSDGVD